MNLKRFYRFIGLNESYLQTFLSAAISIFFFYLYKSEKEIAFLLGGLLFLATTVYSLIKTEQKNAILKKFNKANIKFKSTNTSLFLYSGYKKYSSLFALLFFFTLTTGVAALVFYVQWKEDSINFLLLTFGITLLFFSFLMIILIYYLFLPKIKIQNNLISYQRINLKKMALFENVKFNDLKEIGLGKFEGYFYYRGRDFCTFEKRYYWLLYGIGYDNKRHIFIDFDNTNKELIFNKEWEKEMRDVYEILKERIPDITFNTQIRKLSNPNPDKGEKGWTTIGVIN